MSDLSNEVLKRIDPSEIRDLTLDLVKIPSETGHEEDASKFYADLLNKMGLEIQLDPLRNVIARIRGEGEGPSLMLNGHIDTIPIGKCVSPKFDDDKIYGRGACDMKGSLAAMAQAAKAMVESGVRFKGDLWITAVTRHEVATTWPDQFTPYPGEGARAIVQAISKGDLKVNAIILTEAIGGHNVVVAHKGLALFNFYVSSTHPSHHTESVLIMQNPIPWTAELIKELVLYNEELSKRKGHPLTGSPSLSFGIISGGDYFNRIPTLCKITGTRRWNPGENMEDAIHEFEVILDKFRQCSELKFSQKVYPIKPAFEVPKDERIVKIVQKNVKSITGKDVDAIGISVATDAGIFCNEGGVPTVCFGPSEAFGVSSAHSDIEHVNLKNLETLARVISLTALDFCGVANRSGRVYSISSSPTLL